MALAYYAREASQAFWDDHWTGRDVAEALRMAERSPLTALIESALPPEGRILEGGCGLGQYVVLWRRRGRAIFGVDWSLAGLRRTREVAPPPPVGVMELDRLGFRAAVFDAYISLGVVEHDPRGPGAIVREARRVLRPGGVLIISVPYINGLRRIASWWIRRANAGIARGGGAFYQFAFGSTEFRAELERLGFRVVSACPYDPARLLRRLVRGRRGGGHTAARPLPASRGLRPLAVRALYARPALALLGHMILFVAVRDPQL